MEEVFAQEEEIKRLAVQKALLKEFERPIYERVIAGRSELCALDIGCNDGSKTIERFTKEHFSKVIGIDILDSVVEEANRQYGDDVYSFYCCNTALKSFSKKIQRIIDEEGVKGFDVINCSFVLMHVPYPEIVLSCLRRYLLPDGQIVIIEPDDTISKVTPDHNRLFKHFSEILMQDVYAGKRDFGRYVPGILEASGFSDWCMQAERIFSEQDDKSKKSDVFVVFCSYLKNDLEILRKEHPGNKTIKKQLKWVRDNEERLYHQMVDENTEITIGIKIFTGRGGQA